MILAEEELEDQYPYIDEKQRTQWPKVQKDKLRSTNIRIKPKIE